MFSAVFKKAEFFYRILLDNLFFGLDFLILHYILLTTFNFNASKNIKRLLAKPAVFFLKKFAVLKELKYIDWICKQLK